MLHFSGVSKKRESFALGLYIFVELEVQEAYIVINEIIHQIHGQFAMQNDGEGRAKKTWPSLCSC